MPFRTCGPAWAAMPLFALLAMAPTSAHAHQSQRSTFNYADSSDLGSTLNTLVAYGANVEEIATSPTGQWVIVAEGQLYASSGVPSGLRSRIQQFLNAGREVDAVILGPNGSWAVAAEDLWARSNNLPNRSEIQTWYNNQRSAGRRVTEMTLTPQGGYVLIAGTRYKYKKAGNGLSEAILDRNRSKRRITSVSVGADGRWLVVASQAVASRGLNGLTMDRLRSWQAAGTSIDHAVLGVGNNHILYSHETSVDTAQSALLDAIEYGLGNNSRSIWRRMQDLNVPGVTLAIVRNGRVEEARGYGQLDASDRDRWVTARSPFAVASMSKYITSLGLARVVEAGDLGWHDDAATLSGPRLTWWRLAKAAQGLDPLPNGMTMVRMMRHTGAITEGWGGYSPSGAPAKTTLQVLLEAPCSGVPCSRSGDLWHDPAEGLPTDNTWDYANAHYEVIRAAMEDARGQDFAAILDNEVFGPLGMTDSTFAQPLTGSYAARAALGHDANGAVVSARPVYDWLASGGLYTTPRDYAQAMIALMDVSATQQSGFLSAAQTDKLRRDPARFGTEPFWSAARMTHSAADAANGAFCHGGWLPDLARSHMYAAPSTGNGIVVITNGERGGTLTREIRTAFRNSLGTAAHPECN